MWFDYQALFDKTKNIVLGKQNSTEVQHADFTKNKLALKAVFDTSEYNYYYEYILEEITSSDVYAQLNALYNVLDCYKNNQFTDQGELIYLNYKYMFGLVAAFFN